MRESGGVAFRLAPLLTRILGEELPVRVRAWDGSEIGPPDAPAFVVRDRRALRRLLWKPGEIGLARAYVAGELDIDGDVLAALGPVLRVMQRGLDEPIRLSAEHKKEIVRLAVTLGAVGPEPRPPAEEVQLAGLRYGRRRGDGEMSPHLDVASEFFELLLGPSMTYSSAYWCGESDDLDEAQRAKFDLVARWLGLAPGMRLLDVGCGWGTFLIHAAQRYGVRGVGLARTERHAEYARKRVAEAGLEEQVEIRVADVRELAETGAYDAVANIGGIGEHVGRETFAEYARAMYRLLRPGGRLANQQIVRRPGKVPSRPTFMTSYVYPDGVLLPLGSVVGLLEEAGFEVRNVASLREHYARTIRHWVSNLRGHWEECVRIVGPGVARVWLLYLAVSAIAFEMSRIGVHHVLAVHRHDDGRSEVPWDRAKWPNLDAGVSEGP